MRSIKEHSPDKIKKSEFICPYDIVDKFEYEEELSLTKILEKIANLYPSMKKLKRTQISEILTQDGLLDKSADKDGKL